MGGKWRVWGGHKHKAEGDEKIRTLVVAKLVELALLAFSAIAEAEGGEALLGLVGSGAKGYWERSVIVDAGLGGGVTGGGTDIDRCKTEVDRSGRGYRRWRGSHIGRRRR